MKIEIYFGWWLLPFVITLISFGAALVKAEKPDHGGYLPDFVTGFFNIGMLLIAALVSLASWLIWSLL